MQTHIPSKLIAELENIINDICSEDCLNALYLNTEISLLSGKGGQILFNGMLYNETESEKNYIVLERLISDCIKTVNSSKQLDISFIGGVTGFFWVLSKLRNKLEVDNLEYYLSIIDRIVIQSLRGHEKMNFDPFVGYLGLGNYLLERDSDSITLEGLELIVDRLWVDKQIESDGFSWIAIGYDPNEGDSIKYNLGLAHGVPAILMVLSNIYKKGVKKDLCKLMILKGLDWMMAKAKESRSEEGYEFYFPKSILSDGEIIKNRRLAWCYGDLPISIVLNQIGKTFEDSKLVELSEEIALNCSRIAIDTPPSVFVQDGSLCHGAFGNAYMFHKLFLLMNHKSLLDATICYLEYGVHLSKRNAGKGGFLSLQYDGTLKSDYLFNDYSLLTGSAGVGLAILSVLKGDKNSWSRCLLLE
jgi:lantibiotic modifying enzyme